MARVLAVANRTIGRGPLVSLLAARAAAGDEIFLVVPASNPSDDEVAFWASEHVRTWPGETNAVSLARWRLHSTVNRLERLGVKVDGDIGDRDPVRAAAQALGRRPFDEIILSTMPRSVSRWIAMDVPRRLRRRFELPVHHVEAAEAGPSPAARLPAQV